MREPLDVSQSTFVCRKNKECYEQFKALTFSARFNLINRHLLILSLKKASCWGKEGVERMTYMDI